MKGTTRRQFLKTSAGASAGMASWLALGTAPAFAQKRELTFLSWNHFVPAADDELRRQAEEFGKQAGASVRVDTIAHLQMPAKVAAEAQSQSGHDMYRTAGADPFLGEGISIALGYGALAALEIGEAFQRNRFCFAGYRRRVLKSALGQVLIARWFVAHVIYWFKWRWFQILIWRMLKPLVVLLAWIFILNWGKRMPSRP